MTDFLRRHDRVPRRTCQNRDLCWGVRPTIERGTQVTTEADIDVYSWVLEYRKELSVRLSELDLLLRIVDDTDVAFVEQARYESARGIKLLRREPLGTYDSILALLWQVTNLGDAVGCDPSAKAGARTSAPLRSAQTVMRWPQTWRRTSNGTRGSSMTSSLPLTGT
jgi:hypothetical protein